MQTPEARRSRRRTLATPMPAPASRTNRQQPRLSQPEHEPTASSLAPRKSRKTLKPTTARVRKPRRPTPCSGTRLIAVLHTLLPLHASHVDIAPRSRATTPRLTTRTKSPRLARKSGLRLLSNTPAPKGRKTTSSVLDLRLPAIATLVLTQLALLSPRAPTTVTKATRKTTRTGPESSTR